MGVFDSLERGLERAVKAPFAKVFKAEVQPVEIAANIRGAMDDRAAVLGPGRVMVPNVFTVELAQSDYERLSSYDKALTDELVAASEDHADAERYTTPGPIEIRLTSDDELETGVFRVRPTAKDGRRAQRRPEPAPERAPETPPRQQAPEPQAPRSGASVAPSSEPPRPAPPGTHLRSQRPAETQTEDEDGDTRQLPSAPPPPRRTQQTRGPQAWLDIDGRKHPLGVAVTSLGRDESAMIVVDDPGVSRRHAEIRITYDGPHLQVLIRDAGSTNGTFLNGEQIGTEELGDGDRITLGRTTITFHVDRSR